MSKRIDKTLKEGHKHLRNGEIYEAKESYLNVLSQDPDNLTALNNLSQIYALLQDTSKSKSYSEILLEECNRHKSTEQILVLKSNALITLDMMDEANEAFDEILKMNPQNTTILYQKSNYLEVNGKLEESLKCIEKVIKIDCNLSAILSKARILLKLKRFDEAEKLLNLAFEMEPKSRPAMNLKSKLIKEKSNSTIAPHDFMIKGLDAWQRDEFSHALAYLDKAIDLDNSYDEIWYLRGELLIRMGRINDAMNSFERAFELNPTSGGIAKKRELFRFLNVLKKVNTLLGFEESS